MCTVSTKLSDIALQDYSVVPLLNRFGIYLGLGDATVGAACRERGIDSDFFIALINTFLREDYFPDERLLANAPAETVDYLSKTNSYCIETLLPNIERHFLALQQRSRGKNNLEFLWKFFLELKNEMVSRMDFDSEKWFPAIAGLQKRDDADGRHQEYRKILSSIPADESGVEERIDDLRSFFIIHLRGDYDHNLCMAVVTALSALDKEIRCNNRIRERILRPLTAALLCGGR